MSGAVRLLCLPYAGGNARSFARWSREFPEHVEICPVQPPGRGERIREAPLDEVGALLADLFARIAALPPKPTALFGHSLGAVLAFESARFLVQRGQPPVRLFVSGHRAPHLPLREEVLHHLGDAEFLDALTERSPNLRALDDPEFRKLLLPMLRADYTVSETYEFGGGPPLDCPISALGGHSDPDVSTDELDAWRAHTTGGFDLRMFDGDHFFVDADWQVVARHVAGVLSGHSG